MTVQCDAFFAIGSTHDICQDYALALNISNRSLLIVSDGCSASPSTDIGARILSRCAAQVLLEECSISDSVLQQIIEGARKLARLMSLPMTALDCTLMIALVQDETIEVCIVGDGVLACRHYDGHHQAWEIRYNNNAPAYLNYQADPERLQCFLDEHNGFCVENLVDNSVVKGNGADYHRFSFSTSECQQLFLFSDGVSSFPGVPISEVLTHLMSIKSTKGRFVLRRGRRFLRKTCRDNHWQNTDDLSIAGMYFEEENGRECDR